MNGWLSERGLRAVPYTGVTGDVAEALGRTASPLRFGALFVLVIACANVASFQLARAASRAHETSLRIALGAGRGRLWRGVLADSTVIAIGGGSLGLLLAWWTATALPGLLFAEDAALLAAAPNLLSIAAASASAVAVVIACGFASMLEVPYDRPALVLRREGQGASTTSRRLRTALVAVQMACCCVLIISAGYLREGLRSSIERRAGNQFHNAVLATVQADGAYGARYFADIERAASGIAGVRLLGWTRRLPGSQAAWRSFRVDPHRSPKREVRMDVKAFTASSVDRFWLPPVAGRMFGRTEQECASAVVNEEAASVLFGGETPGRIVRDPAGVPVVIAGVLALRDARLREGASIYYDRTNETGPASAPVRSVRYQAAKPAPLATVELNTNVVSPEYAQAAGFAVVSGRMFPDEPKARRCRVAVVNRDAAEAYFDGNATGAAVIDDMGVRTEIIGVVDSPPIGAFERRAEPSIYFPMAQDFVPRMTLVVNVPSADAAAAVNMQRVLTAVPGHGPEPMLVRTLRTYLSQTGLAPLRIAMLLMSACAAIALGLSVAGLYGTLSDAARRQRRETAIRIALGARRRHVVSGVLGQGARVAAVASVAGVAGAALLSHVLARMAPGGEGPALWVWMAGPLVLGLAVVVASVAPARRSAMTDPVVVLRDSN